MENPATEMEVCSDGNLNVIERIDGEVRIVAAMDISTSLHALTERSPLMQQCESPRH